MYKIDQLTRFIRLESTDQQISVLKTHFLLNRLNKSWLKTFCYI